MPRPPRIEYPGAVHHVYSRGNNRQPLFLDDEDRSAYLTALEKVIKWKGWQCLAFVLMPNHSHFVFRTPKPNLASGMQWLHGSFARKFNDRHRKSGHLFQGRYGSKLVLTDEHLWTVLAYVVRNPVAAGLCARPEHWRWGSHAAVLGGNPPDWLAVDLLADYFGGADRYAAFVATGPES